MYKSHGRQALSLLLCFLLVVSAFPVLAQAADRYTVTLPSGAEGSVLLADPETAQTFAAGETVTLKIQPATGYGYVRDSLSIASADGARVVPYEKTDTLAFRFSMPAHNVVVRAQFRQKPQTGYAYFYEQLKDTDPDATAIYDALLQNARQHNTAPFAVYPESGTTSLSRLSASAYDALAAFLADHPRYFWLYSPDSTPRIRANLESSGRVLRVVFRFDYDVAWAKAAQAEMDEVVRTVVAQATQQHGTDTFGKLKYFHDYIVNHTRYKIGAPNSSNAYGVLNQSKNKLAVCDGYAQAFKVLCDAAGIPNVLVAGQGLRQDGTRENHRWNYVQLKGTWYAVDTTWDDPLTSDGSQVLLHTYFLKGSVTMQKDHLVEHQFITDSRSFTYPPLSRTDYVHAS